MTRDPGTRPRARRGLRVAGGGRLRPVPRGVGQDPGPGVGLALAPCPAAAPCRGACHAWVSLPSGAQTPGCPRRPGLRGDGCGESSPP